MLVKSIRNAVECEAFVAQTCAVRRFDGLEISYKIGPILDDLLLTGAKQFLVFIYPSHVRWLRCGLSL